MNRVATDRELLHQAFRCEGVSGCTVILPFGRPEPVVHGQELAAQRRRPASTFKILNALIALELGIVNEADEVDWDGTPTWNDDWKRSFNIRAAFQASAVWFFQRLARQIGIENYKHFLSECQFGNAQCGKNLDSFWLDGTLLISPIEQVGFIERLATGDLPFRPETIASVQDFMVIEQTACSVLRAKTGWIDEPHAKYGWFVGYRETDAGVDVFATQIDMPSLDYAPKRRRVTERCLNCLTPRK